MTRKLPWDRDAPASPRDTTKLTSATSKGKKKAGSTVLPAGQLSEKSMAEGLQQDDNFRMVEDEFLTAAHKFTTHLHAAEYERLKDAVKHQNTQAIRNMSRPVVGQATTRVQREATKKRLRRQQQSAMQKIRAKDDSSDTDSETDTDGDGPGALSLAGLMESPKKAPSLGRLAPAAARGAFGNAASQSLSSSSGASVNPPKHRLSDDEDDFDAPRPCEPSTSSAFLQRRRQAAPQTTPQTAPAASASAPQPPNISQASSELTDDDDPFGGVRAIRERRRKRRRPDVKARQTQERSSDFIPDF